MGTSLNTRGVPDVEYGPGTTYEVGGSRFAFWNNEAVNPVGWGQQWEAKPEAYPTVPPMYGNPGSVGVPTTTNVAAATSAPLSPRNSPVVWVVLGIAAIAVLHWLHWHEPKASVSAEA
jgi:hypothetical protein